MPAIDLVNSEFAPGELASLPFATGEYHSRWKRARAILLQEGIDALVLSSQRNFEYIVGYRTPAWYIKSRPLIVVVPSSGAPFVVASEAHAAEIQAEGVVDSLIAYVGFEEAATDGLIQGLAERGLGRGALGFELGHEQRLGLPFQQFQRLRDVLSDARIIDATSVIWQLRLIKSQHEVAYLREAGRITGAAYTNLLSSLREGWTQWDVYREFGRSLLAHGGDGPEYLTMTGGPGHYDLRNSWPGERAFVADELFWMDVAAPYRAYFADYTRCASVGRGLSVQRQTYLQVHEILDHALDAVRAGVEASAIMAAAQEAAQRRNLTITVSSRIGHGVGLDLTEPPSLTQDATDVLVPGMVIAVEPGVITDHGFFHLEENVVVLANGYAFLSEPMPQTLPEVGL